MILFQELLQISLGNRNTLSRTPSKREWEEMYDEAERQGVVGLLLCGLERLPSDQLSPLEVKLQWIGMVQMMEAEYRLHSERAVELTSLFYDGGFRSCVLKGLSSSSRFPQPSRRQNGDIDLWVFGSTKEVLSFLRERYKLERVLYHHADMTIFDDVDTEIHYRPSWLFNPLNNHRLQKWFKEQAKLISELPKTECGYIVTPNAFDAVYQLIHISHHLMDMGIGLRHVVDYYYVMVSLSEAEREEAWRILQRIGLARLARGMMYVLQELCGMPDAYLLCTPNKEEGHFILQDIVEAGNFGRQRKEQRSRFLRNMLMLKHYPCEVLWMLPWRAWHFFWRRMV